MRTLKTKSAAGPSRLAIDLKPSSRMQRLHTFFPRRSPLRSLPLILGLLSLVMGVSAAPLRVLILTGRNNHDWAATTPVLKSILTASGAFTVEVTEHPEQCDAATFARYDALLSNWNNFGQPADTNWPEPTRRAFLEFVRQGKGLVVVHAGSSSYYDWPEYQQLVGGSWKLGQTGHGPGHRFAVRPVTADHPVTRGLGEFTTTDELWHRTGVQPGITILATAFSAKDQGGSGNDEPVVFTTRFGEGRCFNLVLGHDAQAMQAPGFQTLLLRGTEWAASGQVTLAAVGSLTPAQIAAALQEAAAYRFGESRAPLLTVAEQVARASADAAARPQMAAQLAALLSSDATVEAKQFICGQLSIIGSAAEVPALVRHLPDTNFTYDVRLALERIPGDASLEALRAALSNTTGPLRLGVINSVAVRRCAPAIPALAKLTSDSDAGTALAAIDALGKIGGAPAVQALQAARPHLPAPLKVAVADALLRCADVLLEAGNRAEALPILEELIVPGEMAAVRLAAIPLYVSAGGAKSAELLTAGLAGADPLQQAAAIRALRSVTNSALVAAAAGRLASLTPELQVPVIAVLGERGDAAALPALTQAVASKDPAVQRAAIVALGSVGNAGTVPVLARLFEAADPEIARLLVESLARLKGTDLDATLISELKRSGPAAQRGLVRALTLRGTPAAISGLVAAAASTDARVRREALSGLEKVGDRSVCAPLIQLLAGAGDAEAIAAALAGICSREGNLEVIIDALPQAAPVTRIALLRVLATVGGPRALETVRAAVKSDDAATRTAAVRALADWPDAAPLDDLVALAATAPDAQLKNLALRSVARLAPLAKGRPAEQLAALLDRLLASASVAERKALLGALSQLPAPAALQTAAGQLQQPGVAEEAGLAVVTIAEAIGKTNRAEAVAALEAVSAVCKNPTILERAAALSVRLKGPQNLSLGATATNLDGLSPDGQGGGPPSAIDDNSATYWDETDNQELYVLRVQLRQRSPVASLRIQGFQQHNFAPKDFEVVCDDKVVKRVTNAQYADNWLSVLLPVTDCTTVELRITGYYGASPAIRELEIYGPPPAARK